MRARVAFTGSTGKTVSRAVHSFTVKEAGDNPSSGVAYNAEADARSWRDMQDFFKEVLKK